MAHTEKAVRRFAILIVGVKWASVTVASTPPWDADVVGVGGVRIDLLWVRDPRQRGADTVPGTMKPRVVVLGEKPPFSLPIRGFMIECFLDAIPYLLCVTVVWTIATLYWTR